MRKECVFLQSKACFEQYLNKTNKQKPQPTPNPQTPNHTTQKTLKNTSSENYFKRTRTLVSESEKKPTIQTQTNEKPQ